MNVVKEYKDIYEKAVDILADEGHEADLRDDYIGRFRDKPTLGIVTDAPGPVVGAAIAKASIEEGLEEFEALPKCWDSMGLSTIYYI